MAFIGNPPVALRDIGPGADIGQPFRDGVDVAVGLVDAGDVGGKPVGGNLPVVGQKAEDARQQPRMFPFGNRPEVRNAADIPQQPHRLRAAQLVPDLGHLGQGFQRQHIVAVARPRQPVVRGGRLEAADQAGGGAEFQHLVAPVQFLDRRKAVVFDGIDQLFVKGARLARHTEGPVVGMPPRPAGDLADLVGEQRAHAPPVIFCRRSKGDVPDIQVKPHADGIGGHQVIDIPVLIKCHLGIARARRQRPHDHGAATLLAADQFGNRIDILNRKANDGTARWHAAYLFRTGPAEF